MHRIEERSVAFARDTGIRQRVAAAHQRIPSSPIRQLRRRRTRLAVQRKLAGSRRLQWCLSEGQFWSAEGVMLGIRREGFHSSGGNLRVNFRLRKKDLTLPR